MIKEIWKDIPGYEGYYQISSKGQVKSLEKTFYRMDRGVQSSWTRKEKILKLSNDTRGYNQCFLCKQYAKNTFSVHRLVALAFFGESDLFVDHINGIKTDNRVENLRYVDARENSTAYHNSRKTSSTFVGVSKESKSGKWKASITLNGDTLCLGSFKVEKEASVAYKASLKTYKHLTKKTDILVTDALEKFQEGMFVDVEELAKEKAKRVGMLEELESWAEEENIFDFIDFKRKLEELKDA